MSKRQLKTDIDNKEDVKAVKCVKSHWQRSKDTEKALSEHRCTGKVTQDEFSSPSLNRGQTEEIEKDGPLWSDLVLQSVRS